MKRALEFGPNVVSWLAPLAIALSCAEHSTAAPDEPQPAPEDAVSTAPASAPKPATTPERAGYLGSERPETMLRLTLKLTTNGIDEVHRVETTNTMNRRSRYEAEPTFYRVLDKNGNILFARGFKLETAIRSETQGPDGVMEGHHFELAEPVFAAKVPLFPGTDRIQFLRTGPDGSRESAEVLGEVRR